ncbi:hypothetical protein HaLaN_20162, partial [Haematococcus lacustris]
MADQAPGLQWWLKQLGCGCVEVGGEAVECKGLGSGWPDGEWRGWVPEVQEVGVKQALPAGDPGEPGDSTVELGARVCMLFLNAVVEAAVNSVLTVLVQSKTSSVEQRPASPSRAAEWWGAVRPAVRPMAQQ